MYVYTRGKSEGEKREHEIAVADEVKENPNKLSYINRERVTRERIGPLKFNNGVDV